MRIEKSFAALSLLLAACSSGAPVRQSESPLFVVQPGESANAMSLKVNQPLVLRLPSNPTTGFSWVLVSPLDVLQSEGAPAYEANEAPPGMVGAGGNQVWKFRALRSGEQLLRFEYRRPWEKDAAAGQISTYRITVR